MGNVYYLVQWYSLFSVYLGSLWILILGMLFSQIKYQNIKQREKIIVPVVILILPCVISLCMYSFKQTSLEQTAQITTYLPISNNESNFKKTKILYNKLTEQNVEQLIVCPEVFLSSANIYSSAQKKSNFYFDKYLNENPKSIIVYGQELKSKYNLYNTIVVKKQKNTVFRVKQKYVPIREYTPTFIEKMFKVKSYYNKNKQDHTQIIKQQEGFTPLVCYESIFSSFTANLATNSNFIILCTSEEFMNGSNYGKKQYLNIVRLRAIETQKQIIKCSNLGTSCILNKKGAIIRTLNSEIENIKININPKNSIYQQILSRI